MLWLCLRFPLLPLEVFIQDNLGANRPTQDDIVESGLLEKRALEKNTCKNSTMEGGVVTNKHPAAVIEQHRILVCNAFATTAGITPGMSLATAQALCSVANIFERDIRLESLALQTLAYSCYRFTPAVTLCPPDSLLLEIGGCLKLFKGLQRLLMMINETIVDLGHEHTVGLAITPKAAALLSRVDTGLDPDCSLDPDLNLNTAPLKFFDPDVLDIDLPDIGLSGMDKNTLNNTEAFEQHLHTLPLDVLDCSSKLKDKFRSTGFYCLGDLLRLPGAALGKRYGKDFLVYLKQLTGELPDPQQALELPPQFEGKLDFNDGITSTEMLAFPMKRLLLTLSAYLYGRQLHCSQIRWCMHLVGGNTHELLLHFAQAHNRLEHFLSMSRLKLDNQVLPAPVESLALHADHLRPAEQKNADLFGPLPGDRSGDEQGGNDNSRDDDMTMVLDKLRTRLGKNSVYGLSLADSHIPEQAWKTISFGSEHNRKSPRNHQHKNHQHRSHQPKSHQSKSSLAKSTPSAINKLNGHDKPTNRPLWLLQNPAPVQVRNQRLFWRGELQLLQGPERIEGNWWQQAICRDYFIARHHNGALHWVYRDRLSTNWFVHGTFG